MPESAPSNSKPERKRRSPSPRAMPTQIADNPRDLARAIVKKPPEGTWRYMGKKEA